MDKVDAADTFAQRMGEAAAFMVILSQVIGQDVQTVAKGGQGLVAFATIANVLPRGKWSRYAGDGTPVKLVGPARRWKRGVSALGQALPVAIKLTRASDVRTVLATLREAIILSVLSTVWPFKALVPMLYHVALVRGGSWHISSMLTMERADKTLEEYLKDLCREPAAAGTVLPSWWIERVARPIFHLLLTCTMLRLSGIFHRDLKPANVLVNIAVLFQLLVTDFGMSRPGTSKTPAKYTECLTGTPGFSPAVEYLEPHTYPDEIHGMSLEERERLRAGYTFMAALLDEPLKRRHVAGLVPGWDRFAESEKYSPTPDDLPTAVAFLGMLAVRDMEQRFAAVPVVVASAAAGSAEPKQGGRAPPLTLGEVFADICRRLLSEIRSKALSEEAPAIREAFAFLAAVAQRLQGNSFKGAAANALLCMLLRRLRSILHMHIDGCRLWSREQVDAILAAVRNAILAQQRRLEQGEKSVLWQLVVGGGDEEATALAAALVETLEAHMLLTPVNAVRLLQPLLQLGDDGKLKLAQARVFFAEWRAWLHPREECCEQLRQLPTIVKQLADSNRPLTAATLKLPHMADLLRPGNLSNASHDSKAVATVQLASKVFPTSSSDVEREALLTLHDGLYNSILPLAAFLQSLLRKSHREWQLEYEHRAESWIARLESTARPSQQTIPPPAVTPRRSARVARGLGVAAAAAAGAAVTPLSGASGSDVGEGDSSCWTASKASDVLSAAALDAADDLSDALGALNLNTPDKPILAKRGEQAPGSRLEKILGSHCASAVLDGKASIMDRFLATWQACKDGTLRNEDVYEMYLETLLEPEPTGLGDCAEGPGASGSAAAAGDGGVGGRLGPFPGSGAGAGGSMEGVGGSLRHCAGTPAGRRAGHKEGTPAAPTPSSRPRRQLQKR